MELIWGLKTQQYSPEQGSVKDNDTKGDYLQDLWRFDLSAGRWSNETARVAGAWPSPREWANTWTDGQGVVWVFAGTSRDKTTPFNMGVPNDLWRLDTSKA